ncbi:salicylate/benzoate carboxyl methyltransferase-like isoform X1 [Brassica napus]|uniref:salicylate/benzoate carboxyl methyltransferase-like isoform X1 n=1 Tax=Brassica napus TaxID=3708 RepID=UPI002079628C|nr:salicylate/benzoate carboxyl methyltransferase-like isoform X1 [Brassica napus]XP_048615221.1 salicylate/benzoate carboxyl methyltransferase-like isoform X1 [Brassica napus]XP_048615222.1 salicylate/benzoate carboxyl methyltransferase-like isoform X1 [Brassica napus]
MRCGQNATEDSMTVLLPLQRYTDEKSDDEYAFVKALRMSGGVGANSYSANSLLQRRVLSMAKPVLVTNTEEMMMNLNFPNYIKVAELGCSSGQNTFLAISEIINTINVLCQNSNQNPPEIDCCLNDLPENDFNTTFKFVPFFNKEIMMTNQASCFVYGAPGSFYSRLFSRNSLHFIHSSDALHWLSKVPENLENNKENVYISNSSPQSAYKAYLNQFQRDFSMFLTLRSEEIVSNGRMVLTFIGRNTLNSDQFYRDCCHVWTLLSKSLGDLVFEGLVSKPKLDAFNMPFYDPNEQELKEVIQNEGSFEINDLETHGFDLGHSNCDNNEEYNYEAGYNEAKSIRAVTEPMLIAHFGEDVIDILFDKYARHVTQHASCRNKTSVTLVVALTKK